MEAEGKEAAARPGTRGPRKLEGASLEWSRDTSIWDFWLQNRERITFCCFKMFSLWSLVTAARGHTQPMPLRAAGHTGQCVQVPNPGQGQLPAGCAAARRPPPRPHALAAGPQRLLELGAWDQPRGVGDANPPEFSAAGLGAGWGPGGGAGLECSNLSKLVIICL